MLHRRSITEQQLPLDEHIANTTDTLPPKRFSQAKNSVLKLPLIMKKTLPLSFFFFLFLNQMNRFILMPCHE